MSRIGLVIFTKALELLLAVSLWKTYGVASTFRELVALFVAQSEVTQVGTIVCIIIVIGSTLTMIYNAIMWLWRKAAALIRLIRQKWGRKP